MMLSRNIILATASLLLPLAHGQEQYSIDPDSVPLTLRSYWCDQEKATCPSICQQTPPGGNVENSCDPDTLEYSCVCQNGMSPNLTEYSLTMPFFICQEWGTQCVKGCGSDSACASDCTQNHPCGAQNPYRGNKTAAATTTTVSSAGSSSPTQVFSGLGSDGSGSDSDSGDDTKHNGAARLLQYGSIAGSIALSLGVGLGSIMLL